MSTVNKLPDIYAYSNMLTDILPFFDHESARRVLTDVKIRVPLKHSVEALDSFQEVYTRSFFSQIELTLSTRNH